VLGGWGAVPPAASRCCQPRARSSEQHSRSLDLALVHAALGENDAAFTGLVRAIDQREPWVVLPRVEPRWDGIRSDARFQAVLRRAGLPVVR
jgi:hypothetical protein